MGDRFIASLLSDTGRAGGLFQESLYGGMTPDFQRAMAASLIGPSAAYTEQKEQTPQSAAENFLQFPIGSMAGEAPTQGYVSPWTPQGQADALKKAQAAAAAGQAR